MLVLSRKDGQSVLIGDDIRVEVKEIGRGQCQLAIDAPERVRILRAELPTATPPPRRIRLADALDVIHVNLVQAQERQKLPIRDTGYVAAVHEEITLSKILRQLDALSKAAANVGGAE